MSYSDDYVRLRKNSADYSTTDEENSEDEQVVEENDRLDFLHNVFELENEIKNYRKQHLTEIGDKINVDSLLSFLEQGKYK